MASKPRATGSTATKRDGNAQGSPSGNPKSTTQSAAEVIKAGNRRDSLEALRDKLADSLELCEPNVIAQIAGRLQAVLKEISELPAATKVSKADELANRRKARLTAADPPASAGGEGRK